MDFERFEQVEYTEATDNIPVPELKDSGLFGKGEELIWPLRCISSNEMFYARGRMFGSQKLVKDFLEEFLSGSLKPESIQQIKRQIGVTVDDPNTAPVHPEEVIRRVMLMYGTVGGCPESASMKMSINHPETFKKLTNRLYELYSGGNTPGELPGSGEIKG